jgi:hypothetical protein
MTVHSFLKLALAVCIVNTVGCGSDSTAPVTPAIGSDFFVSGRGVRKIWGMETTQRGLGGFLLQDMTVTGDGFVHTVFSYGVGGVNGSSASYNNFRKKINIATGDTVATAGFPPSLTSAVIGTFTAGGGRYSLVPYTDVFAYFDNGKISGTPAWPSVPFPTDYLFSKVYGVNRDAAFLSTVLNTADGVTRLIGQLTLNGVVQPITEKTLGPTTLNASVEFSLAGVPLTFVIGRNDSLSVYNFSSGAQLGGVRLPMIAQYIPAGVLPSYRPAVWMSTKRNRAGTKVIGMIYNRSANVCSTFIYDIATNAFTIKLVNARLDTNLYLAATETFDDEGNVYYVNRGSTNIVRSISPTGGDVVYRTGFLTGRGQVIAVRHVDNRLLMALERGGVSGFSDSRGVGKLLIAVAE